MKKITLVLSCLLLTLGSRAQGTLHKPFGKKQLHGQKQLFKTVALDLPQQTLNYSWIDFDSVWELTDSVITTYNAKGLESSTLSVSSNGWQYKTNSMYDANDRLTSTVSLQWSTGTNTWDSTSKSIITYDIVGNEIGSEHYNYQGSAWVMGYAYKSTYTYNAVKLPLTEETETWSDQTGVYAKESKSTYQYDSVGILTAFTSMDWNNTLNIYQNSYQISDITWYKWNSGDFESSLIGSFNEWDWNGTIFELSTRSSTLYDSHDNTIETKDETLIGSTWLIDYANKFLLTYNNNGNLTEEINQSWQESDSSWNNSGKSVYSNFVTNTGLKNVANQQSGMTIYPNPFSESAQISLNQYLDNAQFVLYDLTGKIVKSQQIASQHFTIEKGDLAPGMYFYYIVTNNTKTTDSGKLIIQ